LRDWLAKKKKDPKFDEEFAKLHKKAGQEAPVLCVSVCVCVQKGRAGGPGAVCVCVCVCVYKKAGQEAPGLFVWVLCVCVRWSGVSVWCGGGGF
jgi:hypothetical protein